MTDISRKQDEYWNQLPVLKVDIGAVEVVMTLYDIRVRLAEAIDNSYGDGDEPTLVLLAKWETLLQVLEITLWACIGKNNRKAWEVQESHSWPYSLEEIKNIITQISPLYRYRFDASRYISIDKLISAWVQKFPQPEMAREDALMSMIAGLDL